MAKLKIYRISQTENNKYDTYDSAIVCAENPKEAREMYPGYQSYQKSIYNDWSENRDCWASKPENIKVEYLGVAAIKQKKGVLLASFNAG